MPENSRVNHHRIMSAIQAEHWAITDEAMQQIVAIARGMGDPEAVAAKLGRPLNNTRTVTVREGVAIVPVIGPIFRYANLFTEISGATSVQVLATDLQAAIDDPNISSIVLEIDSPGGQVSGISDLAQQIRAADSIKPVLAYVGNRAQSAGYFLAASAREVVASDMALLGSVGAAMELVLDEETNSVKFISKQSPLKQADPKTEAGAAEYQQLIDDMGQLFVERMAEYRGVSVDHVLQNFGQGGSMLAAKAIAAGMADRIGTLETLLAELSANPPTTKRGNTMPITREQLAAEAPELLKAIMAEGHAAGMAEGAEAERKRIQEIEALAMPGHEALLSQIKYDGKTTAGEAALQILAAEKQTRSNMAAAINKETPKPLPASVPAMTEGDGLGEGDDEGDEDESLDGKDEVEMSARKTWKKDAGIRAEFGKFETFLAFERANARGAVRIKGGK